MKPRAIPKLVSPYLEQPLRTEAQARREQGRMVQVELTVGELWKLRAAMESAVNDARTAYMHTLNPPSWAPESRLNPDEFERALRSDEALLGRIADICEENR